MSGENSVASCGRADGRRPSRRLKGRADAAQRAFLKRILPLPPLRAPPLLLLFVFLLLVVSPAPLQVSAVTTHLSSLHWRISPTSIVPSTRGTFKITVHSTPSGLQSVSFSIDAYVRQAIPFSAILYKNIAKDGKPGQSSSKPSGGSSPAAGSAAGSAAGAGGTAKARSIPDSDGMKGKGGSAGGGGNGRRVGRGEKSGALKSMREGLTGGGKSKPSSPVKPKTSKTTGSHVASSTSKTNPRSIILSSSSSMLAFTLPCNWEPKVGKDDTWTCSGSLNFPGADGAPSILQVILETPAQSMFGVYMLEGQAKGQPDIFGVLLEDTPDGGL